MSKLRKWFFKLLTGYELIDYEKLLKVAKEILELNKKITKENEEILEIAKIANERYKNLLKKYEEESINEAVD